MIVEFAAVVGTVFAGLIGWRWYLSAEERKHQAENEAKRERAEIYARRDAAVARAEYSGMSLGFDQGSPGDLAGGAGGELGSILGLMSDPSVQVALQTFFRSRESGATGAAESDSATPPTSNNSMR